MDALIILAFQGIVPHHKTLDPVAVLFAFRSGKEIVAPRASNKG